MNPATQTATLNAKAIATMFEFCHATFRRNVADLTHEQTMISPPIGGNCVNWVGGHIVSTRVSILEMLGKKMHWTPEERARYKRGSSPLTDAASALPWERILTDLDASQALLREAFPALTTEQLAAALPKDRNPFQVDSFGEQLAVLGFHESYHVGQLGILRRLAGKSGAIA
jgi:hypothetical protein